MFAPGHDTGQIKTETIDVHFIDPVFQATDDKVRHQGMVGVDRVATTGVVDKDAFIMFVVMIENLPPYPLKIDDGAFRTGFGGVVENHIHDDGNPCLMQGFDQVTEFLDMRTFFRCHAITGMWAEKAMGAVTPIIF